MLVSSFPGVVTSSGFYWKSKMEDKKKSFITDNDDILGAFVDFFILFFRIDRIFSLRSYVFCESPAWVARIIHTNGIPSAGVPILYNVLVIKKDHAAMAACFAVFGFFKLYAFRIHHS